MNDTDYSNESFFVLGARLSIEGGYAWDVWTFVWEQTAEVNATAAILLIEIFVPLAYLLIFGCNTVDLEFKHWKANRQSLQVGKTINFVAKHNNSMAVVLELNGLILNAYCMEFCPIPKKEMYALVSDQQKRRMDYVKSHLQFYPAKASKEALSIFLEKSSFPLQGFWLYWDLANKVVCPPMPNEKEENTLSVLSDANMPTT
ncbi:LOW QUALITY PROTEIN: hypothetical protein M514_02615 [Trichuris suis]|uniref:Uncharacterized protein n=1 Tax=Trichuris suis TaxID=68888 RepID=A0A085MH15_9BILA|nr:LOW QUALITY PROTEIN: hypothetical protein M513_02615 [Trichuris suis]KFD71040.1 LOW QUALITY PROTEIN: hypothetical protein M514_02615 [Trichuris suis]